MVSRVAFVIGESFQFLFLIIMVCDGSQAFSKCFGIVISLPNTIMAHTNRLCEPSDITKSEVGRWVQPGNRSVSFGSCAPVCAHSGCLVDFETEFRDPPFPCPFCYSFPFSLVYKVYRKCIKCIQCVRCTECTKCIKCSKCIKCIKWIKCVKCVECIKCCSLPKMNFDDG